MRSSLFTSQSGPAGRRAGADPPAVILPGGRAVPIRVRRHPRAKRFVLRVSGGVIQLTIPTGARLAEAEAWARGKTGFIEAQLSREPAPVPFRSGARIPVLGVQRVITPGGGRAARLTEDALLVPGRDGRDVARRTERLLRAALIEAAEGDLGEAWHALGVPPADLQVRSMRGRWGSCGSDGRTSLNWRLVFAPRAVLRAVAVHEAAHRLEMNHSPRFWAHVRALMPDYAEHHAWLKAHGRTLFAYGAEDRGEP